MYCLMHETNSDHVRGNSTLQIINYQSKYRFSIVEQQLGHKSINKKKSASKQRKKKKEREKSLLRNIEAGEQHVEENISYEWEKFKPCQGTVH